MPFMEQQPLNDRIIDHVPIADPVHQAVRETYLANLRCPSDATSEKLVMLEDESTGAAMFPVARANYVGVFGTLEIEDDPLVGDGAFFQNSRLNFASFVDGLSGTIVVGERSSKLEGSTWTAAVPGAAEGMARVVGSTDHVPNDPAAHFDDFSSYHATGAHFVLGDGSVRLIADTIDHAVYQALATRQGGEPIGRLD